MNPVPELSRKAYGPLRVATFRQLLVSRVCHLLDHFRELNEGNGPQVPRNMDSIRNRLVDATRTPGLHW